MFVKGLVRLSTMMELFNTFIFFGNTSRNLLPLPFNYSTSTSFLSCIIILNCILMELFNILIFFCNTSHHLLPLPSNYSTPILFLSCIIILRNKIKHHTSLFLILFLSYNLITTYHITTYNIFHECESWAWVQQVCNAQQLLWQRLR